MRELIDAMKKVSLFVVAVALTACGHGGGTAGQSNAGPGQSESDAGVKMGNYRVVLQLPGGDLPFGLELAREGGATVGYLVNGGERLKLSDVSINGNHLDISMPGYETHLLAEVTGDGMKGEVVMDKLGGKLQHIPLNARYGETYRFFDAPASDNADVSGRWTVTFTDDGGKSETAVGEFTQSHDTVHGTVLTTTGDHRYLAGQVRGDELYLSTFDGGHAFLYKAKLDKDGALAGDYWSGTAYHERWTAARNANAALPDAFSLTAMQSGSKQLEFSFPDLNGNTVSSTDAKFRGKVLIVALAGSWCPNCHDEAAFLSPLSKEYQARGLEVVSLMFEHFGDFAQAAAATARFRQHYAIDYTTLIAGVSDKDDASKKLPTLSHVNAFPTTLFVDRRGRVRKIHTGFSGPATGEHYTQFTDEVKATLDQLLAEPG